MIELRKMSEDEFKKFMDHCVPEYAREKMKGEGLSEEAANQLSRDSFAQLLPQGLQSENNFLYSVVEDPQGLSIGSLWFARRNNGTKSFAFIYEIFLDPEARGKGFGKQAMRLLEEEVKKNGMSAIGLHVFGHNKTAISLYEKTGYRVTNLNMMKHL